MTMQQVIVDVREADEFKNERVPGSIHLPLSQLDWVAPGVMVPLKHCAIVLMCRSGNRAKLALERLMALKLIEPSRAEVFQGGILEWKKQGRLVEGEAALVLPLMRQVQLVAGLIIVVGSVLTILVNPNWIYLPLFVGVGLAFAGFSGFCGMALLLQRMPWNRANQTPAASGVTKG